MHKEDAAYIIVQQEQYKYGHIDRELLRLLRCRRQQKYRCESAKAQKRV